MDSEMILKVLIAMGQTFVFFIVGAAAVKLQYLNDNDVRRMGRFTMDVIFPFCCFASVFNGMKDAGSDSAAIWLPPLIGFGIMAVNALFGLVLQWGMKNRSEARMKAFRQMAAINNYLFLPLIIVESLYGARGAGCMMLFSIGSVIGFWSVGIWVMTKFGFDWETLKKLFTSNLIATFLAVLLVLFKVPVPDIAVSFADGLGRIGTPVMLILTGASLAVTGSRMFNEPRDAVWGILCRLIIIPALTVMLLKMLHLPPLIDAVAFIVALMPTSCASVIVVGQYGGDNDYTGQQLLLSTLLSPVTIMGFFYLNNIL